MYLLSSRIEGNIIHIVTYFQQHDELRPPHGGSLSVDLMSIELIREGGVDVRVLSCGAVVPHQARVAFWLHTVKLQVQPLPVRTAWPPGVRQDPV